MLQFPKLLAASVLFLAATGPGMAQTATSPYAYTKPFGTQPQNKGIVHVPQHKPPNYAYQKMKAQNPPHVSAVPTRVTPYGNFNY